jgi:hypothetical protein
LTQRAPGNISAAHPAEPPEWALAARGLAIPPVVHIAGVEHDFPLDIIRDVAKAMRWTHENIAKYGGDPSRVLVMGHSSGGQLAAITCTDDRYLKAEGLSLKR